MLSYRYKGLCIVILLFIIFHLQLFNLIPWSEHIPLGNHRFCSTDSRGVDLYLTFKENQVQIILLLLTE